MRLLPTGRKAWIRLAVLASLILPAGTVQYFWFNRDMGSGPAGPAVSRADFEYAWSERPVELLGIGDSVTAGFGASDGLSYFDRLAQNPPNEFPEMRGICLKAVFPHLKSTNEAVHGTTSLDHLQGQIQPLKVRDRETLGWVVMTTGGNDIIHNYGRTPPTECAMFGATLEQARPWISNFERRLDRMLAELRKRFPGGCRVFLANIYDPTDGVGVAKIAGLPYWDDGLKVLGEYNAVIARCAARNPGVRLVDMRGALLGHGIYCRQFWQAHYHAADPTHWFNANFEDPNDRGYDAIRRAFLNEMAAVAREDRSGFR